MFGMGTGVASLPSSLDYLVECLFTQNWINDIGTCKIFAYIVLVKSSID